MTPLTFSDQPTFHLILRPTGNNWRVSPVQRLRALLKAALRSYGLRCVSAREAEPGRVLTLPDEFEALEKLLGKTGRPMPPAIAAAIAAHNERN
jgi:hypothetical protein